MIKKSAFTIFFIVFSFCSIASAHNNVVVIPMPGEDLVVPRGTNYITLTPADFSPRNSSDAYNRNGPRLVTNGSSAYFDANFAAPHGATIDKITIYYYDNNSSYDLNLYFYRLDQPGRSGETLASITPTGSAATATSAETTTFTDAKIDLEKYAYYFRLYLPNFSNVEFNSIRVDYTYGQ